MRFRPSTIRFDKFTRNDLSVVQQIVAPRVWLDRESAVSPAASAGSEPHSAVCLALKVSFETSHRLGTLIELEDVSMRVFLLRLASLAAPIMLTCCGQGGGRSPDLAEGDKAEQKISGAIFSAKILEWRTGPEVSGDSLDQIRNSCVIEISTNKGTNPESLSVQRVFPYMKIHGHGAPDKQVVFSVADNRVIVDKIAFTMSGPWELHVDATVDGQREKVEIPIVVP